MAITLQKAQTINGTRYDAFTVVTGLSAADEQRLLQGGDALPVDLGGAVSGAGNVATTIAEIRTGDSYTANGLQAYLPSVATVSNGVATLDFAAPHGLVTGTLINATGAYHPAINVNFAPITRVDADTFSFPVPGAPNGPITNGVATFQVIAHSQHTAVGPFPYKQRRSGRAFVQVQNAGLSGYKTADILAAFDVNAGAQYQATHAYHDGYFNNLQYGISADATIADLKAILLRHKALGRRACLHGPLPVNAGLGLWPVLSAPLVTLTDATARDWVNLVHRAMQPWCAANGVDYIDNFSPNVDPATGYALGGVYKSGDFHQSVRTADLKAQLELALLPVTAYKPFLLAASGFENVGTTAASKNICRRPPVVKGAGGTPGAGVTGAFTAWGAGAIPAQRWRTNAGNLYYTPNGGNAANAPVHTNGTVTGGDGVTWYFASATTSLNAVDGVPEGWRVIAPATCPTFAMLIDKAWTQPNGSTVTYKALRCIAFPTINNDQLSITYEPTFSDMAVGDSLKSAMLVSLLTDIVASGSQTPAAQNLKSHTAQWDFFDGTNTVLMTEAFGAVGATNEQLTKDLVNHFFGVEPTTVPPAIAAAVQRARATAFFSWSGAGAAVIDVGMCTILRNS